MCHNNLIGQDDHVLYSFDLKVQLITLITFSHYMLHITCYTPLPFHSISFQWLPVRCTTCILFIVECSGTQSCQGMNQLSKSWTNVHPGLDPAFVAEHSFFLTNWQRLRLLMADETDTMRYHTIVEVGITLQTSYTEVNKTLILGL